MRIGLTVPTPGTTLTLTELLAAIERAEMLGLQAAWVPNIRAYDALSVLTLAGSRTRTLELGTFVVPTYLRHPAALAQQALTAQAATGNRVVLGIGLSHRSTIEGQLGLPFDRPVRHMREYLECLDVLFSGQPATYQGEEFRLNGYHLSVPDAQRPPVIVAALGPQMLRLAGRLADGTAIWVGGPRYIGETAAPTIREAAASAGRPAPRVLASVPVCVTDRPDAVRRQAAEFFARYGTLPSYRAILDREDVRGAEEVALIGDEAAVREGLAAFAQAGTTDFSAAVYTPPGEDAERTLALLAAVARGA